MGYIKLMTQKVEIFNQTKQVPLAANGLLAAGLLDRLKGLLGQSGLSQGQGLALKPCNSIHTFFMRFSIDVLFLDKQLCVIKLIPSMPPNRLSPIVWAGRLVVELPAGTLAQTNTQPSDQIELKIKQALL